MISRTLLFLLPIFATPTQAAPGDPFAATLLFSRSGLGAEISYRIEAVDSGLAITTETRAKGVAALAMRNTARESARYRLEDGIVVPLGYQRDDGGKGEDDARVDFDWEAGKATGSSEGQTAEFAIERGRSYDTLTVELATRLALAAGNQAPEFEVIEGAELKKYRYTRKGEDTVAIGDREYRAEVYELDRQSRRINSYWFVPELDWVMARMEQRVGDKSKGSIQLQSLD